MHVSWKILERAPLWICTTGVIVCGNHSKPYLLMCKLWRTAKQNPIVNSP